MKELSFPAKIYLAAVYCMGCGLFVLNLDISPNSDLLMLSALSLLASVLHIYKVVGAALPQLSC